ncbi:MAG TPA: ABC transporter permease [Stellaceae bacterium]|jgi:phospholipid/cholesterol/gamma-HCH transport system permease protein|nr:ABC transporter permease [Stellaceae bacterium]
MTATETSDRSPGLGRARALLAAIGRVSRARASFVLTVGALGFGVLRELPQPSSWRRPVRAEFARALRQVIGGALATTLVAATLIGIAMVYQAMLWLGAAGQERLIGSILVTVLVREVTPVIVGLIVLGRSGMAVAAELSALQLGGQVHMLTALGLDPFLLLVLPRAAALAIGAYTLGVLFALAAMTIGFIAGMVAGGEAMSLWEFTSTILGAMAVRDFVIFPTKMLLIGLLVALTAALTGLTARRGEDAGRLLPRAFVRGTMAIMLTSVSLSLAI